MRDEVRAQFAQGVEHNQWVTSQAEAWVRSEAQQARRREELVVSRAESEISAIVESEEVSRRRSDALNWFAGGRALRDSRRDRRV